MNIELGSKERKLCMEAAAGCLYAHTRRASRALGQFYEGSLKESGLRGGQLPVLITLALAGPSTISRLGSHLVMDRTTLTRNLKPIEREGLIAIKPGEDRRTRIVSLTNKGYRTLSRALPLWKKNHDRVVKKFGKKNAVSYLEQISSVVEMAGRE
jgi:DNA-binding MarR family transcriptional regulator